MSAVVAPVRFSGLQVSAIVAWPVIVAAVALRLAGAWGVGDALVERPRVVVLDVQGAVQRELAARGGDDKALAAATDHVRDYARSLRSAGYVVLDASYVYAFPAEFESVPAVSVPLPPTEARK
jgi:hypothetical protein